MPEKEEDQDQPKVGRVDAKKKNNLRVKSMKREVSSATWNCWKTTESLWKVLNAINDDKIEKYEWDFILKSMGGEEEILTQNDADFLFLYLDKDNSGDISKAELRALLNLVVMINKWDEKNAPTKEDMIRATFRYALKEKKHSSMIDYTLQMAIISVKNSLTKLLNDMRSAKGNYGLVIDAINDSSKQVFPNPRSIFDAQLKEHEDIINRYAGPSKERYEKLKKLLNRAEEEYKFVNSQVKVFLDQGRELQRLTARDEKCCKIFGCLCPCAF